MKRQKKKGRTNIRAMEKTKVAVLSDSNGITLVALIVSIIVMLILAGVSINAIVGDNGILTQATEAVFLQEITSVKEAYQIWKIDKNETTIPTNGMVSSSELTGTTRLVGEAGYYRTWSISSSKPSTDVTSDADTFNTAFESEFIYYPAGVQDLYYLDTETLGVSVKNTYVIDATNSMIYMLNGATIDGVACYSLEMYYEIKGEGTTPQFAEAEVSGTGSSGTVYAGNVQSEYLEDGSENPDYTPYGFQIIANETSNNVYKLYNNGDLYAKGVKGATLNTSEEEMEIINSIWDEVPEPTNTELANYSKKILGIDALYYIDASGYLWAIGTNSSNRFGLTDEQQQEYTEREEIQLDVNGEKVYNVFSFSSTSTYVITQSGNLYVAGAGGYGTATGVTDLTLEIGSFTQIDLKGKSGKDIEWIRGNGNVTVIKFNDNTYMGAGYARGLVGDGKSGLYETFAPIWDGYVYSLAEDGTYSVNASYSYDESLDIDSKIVDVQCIQTYSYSWIILYDDGSLWFTGQQRFNFQEGFSNYKLQQFNSDFAKNIVELWSVSEGLVAVNSSGEFLFIHNSGWSNYTLGSEETSNAIKKLIIPDELANDGIKEYIVSSYAIYFLSNENELWGIGSMAALGDSYQMTGIHKLNAPQMQAIRNDSYEWNLDTNNSAWSNRFLIFYGMDGKYYSLNCENILKGDNILQKSWAKITGLSVEKMAVNSSSIAIIERDTLNLYVAGTDSRCLAQDTEIQESVDNLTLVDNSLINGKCKDVVFTTTPQMYVLTTDGKIYGTGVYTYYAGWRK